MALVDEGGDVEGGDVEGGDEPCNVQRLGALAQGKPWLNDNCPLFRSCIVPEYLATESVCAVRQRSHGPRRGLGLYQFGVPTDMAGIAARLAQLRVHYDSYYGFDSFQGLPPEARSKSKVPPGDVWAAGAFSEVYRRSSAFHVVKDGYGKQSYVANDDSAHAQPLSVEEAADSWRDALNASANRMILVPGFYNESLTSMLGHHAPLAMYVDINCVI